MGIAPSEYRLPDATRLGAAHLAVANLTRSVDYYRDVIGLRAIEQGGGVVQMTPHHAANPVIVLHEQLGAKPAHKRGRLGLFHVAILLPDRPTLGRFLRHLAEREVPAGMSDHLVSEAIYLTDPDGLSLEVYADRSRDQWRLEGNQLAMGTLPLNVQDLVAAGGDSRFAGAPAGTSVGHMHLHVGDLQRAEAFYHQALGLDKIVWAYPGALFMSAGGYHHHLGTNTWAAGASSPPLDEARLLEWTMELPTSGDVRALAASMKRHHAMVDHDNADVVVRDPWGTQLRVRVAQGAL